MGHLVVCAAQLEAEDGLQIFSLEHDIAAQSTAQICGICEGCFCHDLVDARGEDESKVLWKPCEQFSP